MDELFEIITLIQTKKSEVIPIILVGQEYWDGLFSWVRETMLKEYETISAPDFDLVTIVDSAQEAFEVLKHSQERTFF